MKFGWKKSLPGNGDRGGGSRGVFCRLGKIAHPFGKKIFLSLPFAFRYKMQVKDFIYSRCGCWLRDVKGYRDWQLRQSAWLALEKNDDTGLTIPENLGLTSVVVPVHNNIEYTRRWLYSIFQNSGESPFEIIVFDDGSDKDDYSVLQKDFPGIKLIRDPECSGFLNAVNKSVEYAGGEYVLFLNSDTEVLPGWLDELTFALYHHPEAGMIGSQLIHFRTSVLQECGNIIDADGNIIALGYGEKPAHPRFNFFREVDFCSAVSIILRKEVFKEIRGLDPLFSPIGWEDANLGIRLQMAGYKNYVCPTSKVLHHDMASYGNKITDLKEKNRPLFFQRWSEELRRRTAEPKEKERILYIDAEVPMADRGSGGMDAVFFMEYMLKRGYHVCFYGEYTPYRVPKYTTVLQRMGVECIYAPYQKIWEYLAEHGRTFDHIFLSRIYQARSFDRLLKCCCPQASYIFNTVDLHFIREKLEADLRKDPELQRQAEETKCCELAVAAAADGTIVISRDEKDILENEYHLSNVFHIPQARKLWGLAPNPKRRGAVFIGSAHPPNMDGLRYFHDEILPLLPADFELTIIGENLRDVMKESREYSDLLKCPQFKFAGFVADLGEILNSAKLTIAPLRYGAGTKGKVASSMAYGVPCVSSSFGAEGTGMTHGDNIMIARTPADFAACIQQLEKDETLWKKISDGGMKFIQDHYAPETVEKKMDELFAAVKKRKASGQSCWASASVIPGLSDPVDRG